MLHLGELASTVAESGREMRIMLKDGGEVHLRAVDDSGAHDWVAAIRRAGPSAARLASRMRRVRPRATQARGMAKGKAMGKAKGNAKGIAKGEAKGKT